MMPQKPKVEDLEFERTPGEQLPSIEDDGAEWSSLEEFPLETPRKIRLVRRPTERRPDQLYARFAPIDLAHNRRCIRPIL